MKAVRDFAALPGPHVLWTGAWQSWLATVVTAWDVRYWPFSVGAVVKPTSFLGRLHWPAEVSGLGNGGVSHVELLILLGW